MSEAFHIFLDVILAGAEAIMLFMFMKSFFDKRQSNSVSFLIYLVTYAAAYAASLLSNGSLAFKSLFTIIIFYTGTSFIFRANYLKRFFAIIFWLAYIILLDNINISLISSLLGLSFSEILSGSYGFYLLCFLAKSMELLGAVIICRWIRSHFRKNNSIDIALILSVAIFPAVSLIVSFYMTKISISSSEYSRELLICVIIVFFTNVASVFLLDFLETQNKALKDNTILRHNIKASIDSCEAWKEAYSGQRKLTHDFQNQLAAVKGMVELNAPKEEIIDYLDKLQNVKLPTALLVNTHRTAADVILNQKLAIAKGKDIRFDTQLDDLSGVTLPDDALVIVLSNLIDNAIEACELIPDVSGRHIRLKISVQDGVTFLHIENTVSIAVIIHDNKIVSTKADSAEHGYGLLNVCAVLTRYGGIYSLNFDKSNMTFSFSAQI